MPCRRIRIPASLTPTDEFEQMMLDAGIVPISMKSILKDADGCLRDEFVCTQCDEGCQFDNTVPEGTEDRYTKLARDLRIWNNNKHTEQEKEDAAAAAAAETPARGRNHGKKNKKSSRRHSSPTSRTGRGRGRDWTAADCDTDCSCSDSDDLQELGERESVSLDRARRNRERRKRGGQGGRGYGGWYGGVYRENWYGKGGDSDWGYTYPDDNGHRGGRGFPYGGGGMFDFFSGSPFGFGFGPRF